MNRITAEWASISSPYFFFNKSPLDPTTAHVSNLALVLRSPRLPEMCDTADVVIRALANSAKPMSVTGLMHQSARSACEVQLASPLYNTGTKGRPSF